MILLQRLIPKSGGARDVIGLLAGIAIPLSVVLWAAMKANREKRGNDFGRSNLSVAPVVEWTISFLLPLFIVALGGAMFGYWCCSLLHLKSSIGIMLTGAFYMAMCFAVCYFLSASLAVWISGVLGIWGVAWTGYNIYWNYWNTYVVAARNPSIIIGNPLVEFIGSIAPKMMGIAIGAFLGTLVLALLYGRVSPKARTTAAVCLALSVAPVLSATGIGYKAPRGGDVIVHYIFDVQSPDGALRAKSIYDKKRRVISAEYQNARTGISCKHTFKETIRPVAPPTEDGLYLAQELHGKNRVRVLFWDVKRDQVSQIASVPADERALMGRWPKQIWLLRWPDSTIGGLSPDGRFMLLGLSSKIGPGFDDWLIDLKAGKGWLVASNWSYNSLQFTDATWTRDRIILTGDGQVISVDIRTKTSGPLRLSGRGGAR
jgi:hypothetical protein